MSDYINIFNKEFAGELLLNHLKDYAIKINGKDPLYKPLHSLSILKIRGISPIFKWNFGGKNRLDLLPT